MEALKLRARPLRGDFGCHVSPHRRLYTFPGCRLAGPHAPRHYQVCDARHGGKLRMAGAYLGGSIEAALKGTSMAVSFFDRASTVAPPGYNRFLIPPAALAMHLSIGQAYAFSTFNLPLSKVLGITHSAPGDWDLKEIGWIFSIAIAILGLAAAVFGRWVERVGPRKSMFVAALCFGGGFIVSAIGIHYHMLWIIYLGYGVLGGCGLGIGYISPVSTLIKWFPDRPGMATGMAIMGFGGGALIAAPLSVMLMEHFKTAASNGVLETFVTMGVIYFMYMMIGVYSVRVPAADWKPAGWVAPTQPKKLVTAANVELDVAWRTPQFWLLWG